MLQITGPSQMLTHCWQLQNASAYPLPIAGHSKNSFWSHFCKELPRLSLVQPCPHAPLVVLWWGDQRAPWSPGNPAACIQWLGFPPNNLIISLMLHITGYLTSCIRQSPRIPCLANFMHWQALWLQSFPCQAHSSYRVFACRIWTFPSARSHCAVVFPGLL